MHARCSTMVFTVTYIINLLCESLDAGKRRDGPLWVFSVVTWKSAIISVSAGTWKQSYIWSWIACRYVYCSCPVRLSLVLPICIPVSYGDRSFTNQCMHAVEDQTCSWVQNTAGSCWTEARLRLSRAPVFYTPDRAPMATSYNTQV